MRDRAVPRTGFFLRRDDSTAGSGDARPYLRLVGSEPSIPGSSPGPSAPEAPEPEHADLSPALEDVVMRFGDFVRRTAHRHGLTGTEIEDVVQDMRIRLWRSLGTPDKIRQAPATYIYKTAVSAALDFLRRRRSRREESLDSMPDESPIGASRLDAEADSRESDVRRAVTSAVDLLVESRRAVVRMYLAGYDREEIGSLLGWSEPKTRNLLYRGLADVRATLESGGYGPGGVT
jgi:RNA polymerase sigma factor (sigma-70 family)